MIDARVLFNAASAFAEAFDGSEARYQRFMRAALEFEAAGGTQLEIDRLLDASIKAIDTLLSTNDDTKLLEALSAAGSHIVRHPTIFVKPDTIAALPECERGQKQFTLQPYEPKLQAVVRALQEPGIYFDDLVVDVGRVRESQMRQWPYVIVTIPRLNAQIAVSNQRGQAIFVAQPALDVMDWAIFSKQHAGVPGTSFSHVKRIVCLGAWQSKMLDWVFGAAQAAGVKVSLPGFVRAHRSGAYTLSEGMIVEMAKMYRARHPERQWPSQNSGDIDHDIIEAVTGDADWQAESWTNINTAAVQNLRGLKSTISLPKLLKKHDWGYDLSEEMIVKIANL